MNAVGRGRNGFTFSIVVRFTCRNSVLLSEAQSRSQVGALEQRDSFVFHKAKMEILGVPYPTDALQNYPGGSLTATGPKETASIFATYPAPYLSLSNGFLDQVGIRG